MKDNKGLRNGIILGLIAVVLSLAMYFFDKKLFLNPGLRLVLTIALPIILMRKAVLEERKERGGYISFAEAVQPAYLTLIIGSAVFLIFQYVLLSSDSELLQIQRDIAVESINSIKDFAGLTDENIAQMEDMTAEDLTPNLRGLFLGLAKNFILGFILAALTALALKNQKLTND